MHFLLAIAGLVLLTPASCPAASMVVQPHLGYQFPVPEGWTASPTTHPKVPTILLGPSRPSFRPNLTISYEYFIGTLQEYTEQLFEREDPRRSRRVVGDMVVGEQPARRIQGEFSHGMLPLENLQVFIQRGHTIYVVTLTDLKNRFHRHHPTLARLLFEWKFLPRLPRRERLSGYAWEAGGRFGLRPPEGWGQVVDTRPDRIFEGPWEGGQVMTLGYRFSPGPFPRTPDQLRGYMLRARLQARSRRRPDAPVKAEFGRIGDERVLFMESERREGSFPVTWISVLHPMKGGQMFQVYFELPTPAVGVRGEALRRSLETFVMGPVSEEVRARYDEPEP